MDEAQRAAWDAAFSAEDAAFRRENPQGRQRVQWMYQRYLKNYLRCVAGVDRSVGTLLAWLDAHPDVKQNTLVVYSSDQGFFLGDHGWYDKRWMDEPCLRMPLVMHWPGHVDGGREVVQLTQNIDFAPTFLELAGAPVPTGLHGRSLVPLLEQHDVAWRDAIYYLYYESQATHRVPAMYGVRTQRHKLVRYYEPHVDGWELFDLQLDPDELRSVAGDPAYADVQRQLTERLAALRREYHDDTGELAGDVFPFSAGVTRVAPEDGGFRVWANAQGGWLLQPCEHRGTVVFSTAMRSVAGKPLRNGFVVVSGPDVAGPAVRAGIEFGGRRLVVLGPEPKVRNEVAVPWDGAAPIDVQVTVDLAEHRIVAEANGVRVTAALPAEWDVVRACGFGASNAETWFRELAVR